MRRLLFISLLLAASISMLAQPLAVDTDSIPSTAHATEETVAENEQVPISGDKELWDMFWKGKLDLKDPNIEFPTWMRWFVKLYVWGDQAFNGTDPEYIQGTGKRWKVFLRNDNWSDAYHMRIVDNKEKMNILMLSEPTVNVGAYLQYMAVSVGYSLDFSNIIGNRPVNYKNFEFSFTCQRFTADLYYSQNTGGLYIHKFGNYNNGKFFRTFFDGITMRDFGIDAVYFFNNKKYSQGAAYSFAKYQIKSAGSFMAGFSWSNQDIGFDFFKLPDDMKPYLIGNLRNGKFHYNDFCLSFGYGYNWVFAKHWLANITLLPALGITNTFKNSFEGESNQLGMTFTGKGGIVYNIDDIFLGLKVQSNGHLYASKGYRLFNPRFSASFSAGVRF